MKTIKLIVPVSSASEMTNLVDSVCQIMGQDPIPLKDKFKMIDIPSPKKIMDLCEYFKLKVEFRFNEKTPEMAVSLNVQNNFSFADLPGSEVAQSKPAVDSDHPEPTINPVEETEASPDLSSTANEVDALPKEPTSNFESVNQTSETPEAPVEEKAPEELNETPEDDDDDFPF